MLVARIPHRGRGRRASRSGGCADKLAGMKSDDATLAEARQFVLEGRQAPVLGVVLGSGLGGFAERLEELEEIPYPAIPGMPGAAVAGHSGTLCLGRLGAHRIACLRGRVHAYEGHPSARVTFGVRLLHALGCRAVLLTNAAGGIAPTLRPGDWMFIDDHINLTGNNPLIGPNDPAVGPRFLDLSFAYDRDILAAGVELGRELRLSVHQGVYAGVMGPSYETPAEIRMLATLGASAVGMSTVWEVIALRHRGVRVGALSCITNLAAGLSSEVLSHQDVQSTAAAVERQFELLMRGWLERVGALVAPA